MTAADTLIYLDHAATTPMRREAVEVMLPFLTERFANPSGSHRFARSVRQVVDEARDVVAEAVGCQPGEVVFTGCGTESDNAAIMGVLQRSGGIGVCAAAEHHAVLHPIEHSGGRVVPVDSAALIDLDLLAAALDETVSVVSVMAVNNEVGSITPIGDVEAVVRRHAPNALLHTDAVQAPCWLDLRGITSHVDLLALSAHKFGGPKGTGVLVVRQGTSLEPLLQGGGQERDRRSGTHNVAGIVAMAEALRLTDIERVADTSESKGFATDWSTTCSPNSTTSSRPSIDRSRWPVRRTSASPASRVRRCSISSMKPAFVHLLHLHVRAGRWSRHTFSQRWASTSGTRSVRFG